MKNVTFSVATQEAIERLDVRNLSIEELKAINSMIVDEIKSRRAAQLREFRAGDLVCFEFRNKVHNGSIVRVNSRTATVRVGGMEYRVPPGLLSYQD